MIDQLGACHDGCGGDADAITDATILTAASRGDASASAIIDRVAGSLGLVIWNLARVLNPALIVLAGLETEGRSLLLERVNRALERDYAASPGAIPPVLETALGDDLNLVGAATLALEQFFYAPALDRDETPAGRRLERYPGHV